MKLSFKTLATVVLVRALGLAVLGQQKKLPLSVDWRRDQVGR